ncbi:hypothetical protein AB0I69_36015 [Streptomyces sp. NPDC050508]
MNSVRAVGSVDETSGPWLSRTCGTGLGNLTTCLAEDCPHAR